MVSGMEWWGGCWACVIEGIGYGDSVGTIDETGDDTFQLLCTRAINTQLRRFSERKKIIIKGPTKTDRCLGPNAALDEAHFAFRDTQKTCLIPSIPTRVQLMTLNSNRCQPLHIP